MSAEQQPEDAVRAAGNAMAKHLRWVYEEWQPWSAGIEDAEQLIADWNRAIGDETA